MDFKLITEQLINESIIWLPRLAAVIFIFVLFLVLSRLVKRLIIKISDKLNFDSHLTKFFAQISKIVLILLGLVTALGTVGINVSALVAGLGLTGFALGFAFKDIISNILSGVLILLYRPFVPGDKIKVAGYEGEVVSIDLRYTKLNSEEGIALIPNSKCFSDPVIVNTKD